LVAAAAFVDRVIITADCRLTRRHPGGREEHWDNVLKLMPCGRWTVLGWVGDLEVATPIVRELIRQLGRHERFQAQAPLRSLVPWHPKRLHLWLPRFLRWAYARAGSRGDVEFVVASALPDTPTVISRDLATRMLRDAVESSGPPADWILQVLLHAQATNSQWVALSDTFSPRVLVMAPPDFTPSVVGPFSFAVLGSGGRPVIEGMKERGDDLFTCRPEVVGSRLEIAISGLCAKAGISTVGGLRPTYEISSKGLAPMEQRSQKRFGQLDEEVIQLVYLRHGLWLQRNVTTGMEIKILPPWDALRETPAGGRVFGSDFFDW